MRFITLTDEFYDKYSECKEILHKKNRPYALLSIKVDGKLYGLPIRHHIAHPYSFRTINDSGIDFTKAVLIEDQNYIAGETVIEEKEWKIINREENTIKYEFGKYLNQFKRAMKHRDNPRSKNIIKYSALQYFDV